MPQSNISGYVKWFNEDKGYGFIVPEDVTIPDVLVHITTLQRDGYKTPHQGAHITCKIMKRSRGLQAIQIFSMNEEEVTPHNSAFTLPGRHIEVVDYHGMERAWVKWFDPQNGFGFLTRGEDVEDIFIHATVMRRSWFKRLIPGQTVLVLYERTPNGLRATDIEPDI